MTSSFLGAWSCSPGNDLNWNSGSNQLYPPGSPRPLLTDEGDLCTHFSWVTTWDPWKQPWEVENKDRGMRVLREGQLLKAEPSQTLGHPGPQHRILSLHHLPLASSLPLSPNLHLFRST